jgi:hypothetical protein
MSIDGVPSQNANPLMLTAATRHFLYQLQFLTNFILANIMAVFAECRLLHSSCVQELHSEGLVLRPWNLAIRLVLLGTCHCTVISSIYLFRPTLICHFAANDKTVYIDNISQ